MKFAIDRIEKDIAVLENIDNNDIIEVNVNELPNNVKEKDIVKKENNKYILDIKEKEERISRINEKFKMLKKYN